MSEVNAKLEHNWIRKTLVSCCMLCPDYGPGTRLLLVSTDKLIKYMNRDVLVISGTLNYVKKKVKNNYEK